MIQKYFKINGSLLTILSVMIFVKTLASRLTFQNISAIFEAVKTDATNSQMAAGEGSSYWYIFFSFLSDINYRGRNADKVDIMLQFLFLLFAIEKTASFIQGARRPQAVGAIRLQSCSLRPRLPLGTRLVMVREFVLRILNIFYFNIYIYRRNAESTK